MTSRKTMTNELGERGEYIFSTVITRYHGREKPKFRARFLGDKWPGIDFIVELVGAGRSSPYFFAQVKATRLGYTHRNNRLRIRVPNKDMRILARYPAPTYIVGVDETEEKAFIISANGEWSGTISSLPTDFEIDKRVQNLLWKEVKDYWSNSALTPIVSNFWNPVWR